MNLTVNLGKTKNEEPFSIDFIMDDIGLVLLSGQTCTGKSVLHNHIYKQLVQQNSFEEIGFLLLDATRVDFTNWSGQYLVSDVLTDMEDSIVALENLAERDIDPKKHIFVHIEECDIFYGEEGRTEKAIFTIREKKPNVHIIYSTSRPGEKEVSDELLNRFDLKILFHMSPNPAIRLMGNDLANEQEAGYKIIALKDRQYISIPLSEEQAKEANEFRKNGPPITVYKINDTERYLADFKNRLKKEMGIKCPCNDTSCAECLVSKCTEDNCPVHFMRKKLEFRGQDKNE